MSFRSVASALVLVLSLTAAAPAKADDPADGFRLGAGLVNGLMLNAEDTRARGAINPQQLGFQGLLGYSFPGGFYIGGSMKLFLGQKFEEAGFETKFMTQQFVLDLGYAIGVSDELSVRPMLELALNRYGFRTETPIGDDSSSDVGVMMNPGVDLVADITDHLWLGGGIRIAFALMGGDEMDDINVSDGAIDVSLQLSVLSGLRF